MKQFLTVLLLSFLLFSCNTTKKIEKEKVNIPYECFTDILTITGDTDTAYIYSEMLPDPIYRGSFKECLIIVSNLSFMSVGHADMYYDYNEITEEQYYKGNSKYYNSEKGFWIVDDTWSKTYKTWLIHKYDAAIDDIRNYTWDQ
jgi:hypothetical protein